MNSFLRVGFDKYHIVHYWVSYPRQSLNYTFYRFHLLFLAEEIGAILWEWYFLGSLQLY